MTEDVLENHARIAERLIQLRGKLNARKGNPAYKENCVAIEAEIARLEAKAREYEKRK